MSSKRLFLVILVVYLALAVLYSVSVPLGEAPDEADHYAYVVYLGQNHRLPVGPTVTQSKHPPLYHAVAAALTGWTGLDFAFLRSNPDALPLGPDKPANFFVHTTLESFPWRGGALAMHLARFLSVLLGAVVVWVAWRLGSEVFPARPAVGWIAAAFLAGLPGFLFISGAVNNDNAAGAFGNLALLLSALIVRHGATWRRSAVLGVCLGLGLLSKVGVLALWPLAGLALVGDWWLSEGRRRGVVPLAGRLALTFGLALLLAAPWLGRNWRLYGDPFGWRLVRATVDQRLEPLRWADIGWLLRGFHTSFWGRFAAAGQAVAPTWVFAVAAVATVVLVVAGVWWVVRTRGQLTLSQAAAFPDQPGRQRERTWLLLALLAAAPALSFLSVVRYSAIALGTDQVRLMWPALSALAVWAAVGIVGLAEGWARWRGSGVRDGRLATGALIAMAAFGLTMLAAVVRPAFVPPPPVQAAGVGSLTALADFDGLELVEVELPTQPLALGQPVAVRLLWRAARPLSNDLRPALRLVHSDGWLAAEYGHAPAGGRYSTDRWSPGDVFADDYVLAPQPPTPGVYQVLVGVRPFGGDWLPNAGNDQPPAPFVTLGTVTYR